MMNYEVKLICGDLLSSKAVFLVNASNTAMILGSGVSMAFKRNFGAVLEAKMQNAINGKSLKIGDVVATEGLMKFGSCHSPKILHASVINYTDKSMPKGPDYSDIKMILANLECEILADLKDENLNANTSLALPLLGCGVGGLEISKVAEIYKDFFTPKIDAKLKCEVEIYAYKMEDFEILQRVFA